MSKLRVISILGTRPEAIKLAPVIQLLETDERFESLVIATAQHREMLDQVLTLFDLHPDYDLNLMTADQSLAQLTASLFTNLDPLLEANQPDWVLVQGDTTTAMTAALAAYYQHFKIGHVEAGLRTGDKWQPFPEEGNRRIISAIADMNFAPTSVSMNNLIHEGIPKNQIVVTGNTIIDALNQITRLPAPNEITKLLSSKGIISAEKKLVVVTAHRRENFGQPIRDICAALRQLAGKFSSQIEILYPVHLNPNIQEPVYELLSGIPNLMLLQPLEYLPLIHLLKNASLILTDSGGIQEEATGLGKPCLVLRDVTERPEGVEAGFLRLVGTQPERIISEASFIISGKRKLDPSTAGANPYGDGKASERIIQSLMEGASGN